MLFINTHRVLLEGLAANLSHNQPTQRRSDHHPANLARRALRLPDDDIARDETEPDTRNDAADNQLRDAEARGLQDGADTQDNRAGMDES